MASGSIPLILPRIKDKHLEFKKYLNWLLALMDRRVNAETVYAMPFEVTIDPSTVCQLSCPYCSVGAGTMIRESGVLRPNIHRQILHDISDSLFIIWYFSTGEPLLNRFLPEIIASTHNKEIYSIISTNLSLKLSDERIEKILSCGLGCICVSIDGASAETYSRYRVGGDFELVMHNLRRLVERKRVLGLKFPYIEWRFLIFRHNAHEVPRARELAAEIGVDLLEFFHGYAPPDAPDHNVQSADSFDINPAVSGPAIESSANRSGTTLTKVLQSKVSIFTKPSPVVLDSDLRKKCDWLYFGSTLFPNGSVGPCCLSNEEQDDFGKLSENSKFKDVWNNLLYREARSLWNNQNWNETKRICARCPNSEAQDYQFITTQRALLRNAPDWVLKILIADPDRFFFKLDYKLSPHEFDALLDCDQFLNNAFQQELIWLSENISPDNIEVSNRLKWMQQALQNELKLKKNDITITNHKKSISIATVALFFPENKRVVIKNYDGSEQEVIFNSDVSINAIPITGNWNISKKGCIGLYDKENAQFILKINNEDELIFSFETLTTDSFIPLVGDWNGDGIDSVGLYNEINGIFNIKNNTLYDNPEEIILNYQPTHKNTIPLVGKWNSGGNDTIGLYDRNQATFHLKTADIRKSTTDSHFIFGPIDHTITPLVGDWNGDGIDNIGIYEPKKGLFNLHNKHAGGIADNYFWFGPVNDKNIPLVGDWDGDGIDTVGLFDYERGIVYLTNKNAAGIADKTLYFENTNKCSIPFVVHQII